jgi:hypothetical protein
MTIIGCGCAAPSALAQVGAQIFLIALVPLPPKDYANERSKTVSVSPGSQHHGISRLEDDDRFRWRLSRQEVLVGGIAALFLAVATVAVAYLYH